MIFFVHFFLLLFFITSLSFCEKQSSTIIASQPTHLFYTPTPYVNPPSNLVLSLHEISFSLPGKLQLQASLLDNIGRINFGAKYQLLPNGSIGAGIAHSIAHLGNGAHGIPKWASARLGLFFALGILQNSSLEMNLIPQTQIGDRISAGCDVGFLVKPTNLWSFIGEVGTSVDMTDQLLYLNFDGGIRIHPPQYPFLSFDFGIDAQEFAVENNGPSVAPFIDIVFAIKL